MWKKKYSTRAFSLRVFISANWHKFAAGEEGSRVSTSWTSMLALWFSLDKSPAQFRLSNLLHAHQTKKPNLLGTQVLLLQIVFPKQRQGPALKDSLREDPAILIGLHVWQAQADRGSARSEFDWGLVVPSQKIASRLRSQFMHQRNLVLQLKLWWSHWASSRSQIAQNIVWQLSTDKLFSLPNTMARRPWMSINCEEN